MLSVPWGNVIAAIPAPTTCWTSDCSTAITLLPQAGADDPLNATDGEVLDGTGTVPLGEGSESYEVQILATRMPADAFFSASSFNGGNTPANAGDGNLSTFWLSQGSPSASLTIIFLAPETISGYLMTARLSPATRQAHGVLMAWSAASGVCSMPALLKPDGRPMRFDPTHWLRHGALQPCAFRLSAP